MHYLKIKETTNNIEIDIDVRANTYFFFLVENYVIKGNIMTSAMI